MESLHLSDYSSIKYDPNQIQLKLSSFKNIPNRYKSIISFKFEEIKSKKYYFKESTNFLEALILVEILNGSKLWILNASININKIGLKIDMNPMYIKEYMNKSVGYKAYFDQSYTNLESYNNSYPDISQKSFISHIDPIIQPTDFKVELFNYQKKSIAKMIALEKNTYDMVVNYIYNFDIKFNTLSDDMLSDDMLSNDMLSDDTLSNDMLSDDIRVSYNPLTNTINHSNESDECMIKIKSRGGILCDEMGLGKTITSISLVALNPSTLTDQYKEGLIYSNSTLILCPSHLAKQWETEINKILPNANVIKLLTKNNHIKLTYKDIIDADIIIVTQQFLMNFKYYPQVNYQVCTPSNFSFEFRNNCLKQKLNDWIQSNENIEIKEQPNLEHFYFHRIIVDEGHEIFGMSIGNHSMALYMQKWLETINATNKWFISGTPFINNIGLINSLNFIKAELFDTDNNQITFNNDVITKKYVMDSILSKLLIRHRKSDITNQICIPGYEEEVIWVKLTELERNLYNSKKTNYVSDLILQQLCCHILVSDTTQKYFNNTEVDLDVMQDKLIEYHKNNITKYTNKMTTLDSTNQAYFMLKSTYTTKISESKYMLSILEKISKKDNINIDQNCTICFDNLINTSLTSCGHLFCKECLDMSLEYKKICPMCKTDLDGKDIYIINSKKNNNEVNPLIKKYGSKLGKLISIVRTIITNDDNRIIIFSQWDKMLNLIGKSLSENGIGNTFVKGNVWSKNSAINKFKIGQDNKVIMLSLSNSASGTNLTEASHIIFVEPVNTNYDEMKAIESQAIGRACRIGQKNKIKVIRILTQNTIEQDIYNNIYSNNIDKIKRIEKIDDGTLENEIII